MACADKWAMVRYTPDVLRSAPGRERVDSVTDVPMLPVVVWSAGLLAADVDNDTLEAGDTPALETIIVLHTSHG